MGVKIGYALIVWGVGMFAIGAWMVYPPALFLILGVAAIVVGLLHDFEPKAAA